jgi:hypothetical protein
VRPVAGFQQRPRCSLQTALQRPRQDDRRGHGNERHSQKLVLIIFRPRSSVPISPSCADALFPVPRWRANGWYQYVRLGALSISKGFPPGILELGQPPAMLAAPCRHTASRNSGKIGGRDGDRRFYVSWARARCCGWSTRGGRAGLPAGMRGQRSRRARSVHVALGFRRLPRNRDLTRVYLSRWLRPLNAPTAGLCMKLRTRKPSPTISMRRTAKSAGNRWTRRAP